MEFMIGCNIEEFKTYYRDTIGELDSTEESIIRDNPKHLIIWREGDESLGHAIWHPSNTSHHPDGSPRDETDRKLLENLLGSTSIFAELHELWLRKGHRGRGYGEKFFDFFEDFIAEKGYNTIVYYANHPAALTICRQRGYQEAYGVELEGLDPKEDAYYIFVLDLEKRLS